MFRLGFIAALLLAGAPTAHGQFNYVRTDQQICTLVGCHSRLSTWGTCVAVAHWRGGSVFLSAGHTFEPDTPEHKVVRITIGGADAQLRRYWYDDPGHPRVDFAILYLPGRHADLIPLAATPPEPGDQVSISGYNFDDTSSPRAIHFHGRVATRNRGEYGIVDFAFPVGVSGGPVVRDGELVGLALHRHNHPRNARDISGIQVNYDFKKSVLSFFPGATFEAPPPPALTGSEHPAEPVLKKPVPPPREIPQKQPVRQTGDGSAGAGGRDAEPDIRPIPDPTVPPSGEQLDEESIVKRIIANPALLERFKQAAGVVAPAVETTVDTAGDAATSDWFSSAVTVAATAAFGPPGAAAATIGTGTLGWMWNRRRKRKKQQRDDEAQERLGKTAEENDRAFSNRRNEADRIEQAERKVEELQARIAKLGEPDPVNGIQRSNEDLQAKLDGIVQYLKDREEPEEPAEVPGLTAEQVIGSDGEPTVAYFQDGVRLLKDNRLPAKVLGHKQAAKAIEEYVYERVAQKSGVHLHQTPRSESHDGSS